MNVTVARVGVARGSNADFPSDAEWRRPWDQRETATCSVDEETTYGEILSRAIAQFGGQRYGQPYAIAFYLPEHDTGGVRLATYSLPVLRADGSADWRPWADVTIGQALFARERGLLPGDPLRPYGFVLPKIGNGTLPGWPDLLHMLELLRHVAELLALPGGVAATYALLRNRPSEAVRAIQSHADGWEQRGLDPYLLDEYLDEHPWHSADLAAGLACSVDEAEAVLWALGFARAPSGLWRRGETPEALTLSRIRRLLISTASGFASDPQLADELRRRLECLVKTGRAPEEGDWDELDWLKPMLPGDSALQMRSRPRFARMLRRLGKDI